MAHFLRGRQAGVQNDLSAGIDPELLMPDEVARYGINSLVSAYAYDPVQSLLAVGTSNSQFGPGQIYVFGQKRVSVTLKLQRRASVTDLRFCGNRLVCVDDKNDVSIFNLETKKLIANYAPPGQVTAIVVDHGLDYCLTGLSNGSIVAYDLDREAMTHFKIPNFWTSQNPKARMVPIESLQMHPKDIGSLLIGYSEGAVIYSFKQNKAIKFFRYEVPRGAPGGDGNPAATGQVRYPRLIRALWHPTGTFVLTVHDDGSLVFWDPRDGRVIHARTLQEVDVNLPQSVPTTPGGSAMSLKEPVIRVAWCSKENPDDTGLLVAGGSSVSNPTNGLTWIELGPTPNYQTSSWEVLATHFRNPRRVHVLQTPPNAKVANMLLIPRASPHYGGAHDPIAVLVTLTSGELITLSFPTGHPISPTNQLHVSLTLLHPFVAKTSLAAIDRTRWVGTREYRQQGPNLLLGGAESTKPTRAFQERNVVIMAHVDGTVRVWNAGNGDEVENSIVLQADLGRAVGRWDNINVSQMSMSSATGELSIGLQSGEVVVFRMNRNPYVGKPPPSAEPNAGPGSLTDITRRTDPGLREGLLPLTLINDQQGPVTAVKHSDVGFIAAAYESGGVTVVDLRGPAIIHTVLISELAGKQRRGTIKGRGSNNQSQQREWATAMEFGVMTLEGDDYSSIALFVGTSQGKVLTFKILPSQTSRYSVQFAGMTQLSDDRVISIAPIHSDSGHPAIASGHAVGGLQSGKRINGVLVVTTITSIHVFKPATSKGASKSFDSAFCDAAAVARLEMRGFAVLGLFGDGCVRAFSIPALKEVGSARINHVLDVKRFSDALITKTGDIIGWAGPSEMAIMTVWGANQPLPESADRLYDPAKPPLPRPVISNLQWISGTQYITPSDLDLLIGGPDRPPSKRMVAEMRAQQEAEHQKMRDAARAGRSPPPDQNQEGYWAYMQRQLQERTEALGLTGDSMDHTVESTGNWSDEVSKYVAKQKKQAALGFISSKFGF